MTPATWTAEAGVTHTSPAVLSKDKINDNERNCKERKRLEEGLSLSKHESLVSISNITE